ncbi:MULTISPECIES: hypothetical protein [Avibacterium]|uniref:hypothetical protein n=1 Tax=Avibacterium TaxID=292486 RepID=UPI0021F7B140|nr:hypothetical protein [Avibacterium paragallinarum]UXN35683.1 hypothetical protein N8E86_05670 [Avibacterium paragallinarum]
MVATNLYLNQQIFSEIGNNANPKKLAEIRGFIPVFKKENWNIINNVFNLLGYHNSDLNDKEHYHFYRSIEVNQAQFKLLEDSEVILIKEVLWRNGIDPLHLLLNVDID